MVENKRRPGRPSSGAENKRESLVREARKQFSDLGYDKTTIRSVAAAAGVDPKLVMHYFGNKQKLFVEVMGTPPAMETAAKVLKLTPAPFRGRALADAIFRAMSSGEDAQLVGIIRAASTEPEAAEMIRELYAKEVMLKVVQGLGLDNPELRAVMLSSLLSGYLFTSRIVNLQDLSPATEAQRKALLGKLIQRIFTTKI